MSWYNVAETFYTVAKRRKLAIAEEFLTRLPSLPVRLMVPDAEGIVAAARVKASHAVALGDAFAIALARSEKASVITGDQEIRRCKLVPRQNRRGASGGGRCHPAVLSGRRFESGHHHG